MAEGFTRAFAGNLAASSSAGLSPTVSIDRSTSDVMGERTVSLNDQFPKQFEPGMCGSQDYVINMSGFDLPPVFGPVVLEWKVDDPYGESLEVYREVRAAIELGVMQMTEALKRGETLTQEVFRAALDIPVGRRSRLLNRILPWL